MATAPAIVEMSGVSKRFGHATVIDDIDLTVTPGQIFGLIGPSGCGKSTTVKMLVGVLAPSTGHVQVMGVAPPAFTIADRQRIGYTPQGFFLYPTLTVGENASFVAGLYGMGWLKRRRKIREVLQFLEIWDARKRLARDISGGMQRRLTLACALIHDPTLLLVDEPTAGLDPVLRDKIWTHLRTLRDQGTTVFVTTQYIDEAAYCDTVAILDKGKVAAVGSPQALRHGAMGGDAVEVDADGVTKEEIVALLRLHGVSDVKQPSPGKLRVIVEDVAASTPAVIETLESAGVNVTAVRPYIPSFDEVFMTIVGRHVG